MDFKLILRKMLLGSIWKKCCQEEMTDARMGLGNGAGRTKTAAAGRRH